jgi:hypothetical protein
LLYIERDTMLSSSPFCVDYFVRAKMEEPARCIFSENASERIDKSLALLFVLSTAPASSTLTKKEE